MGLFALLLPLAVAAVSGTVSTPDLDLILYGATGCVGGIAAKHLADQPGLRWAIAGRNESKLRGLMSELAALGGPSSKPAVIVAPLDGSTDPSTWVGRARAVITAAGPFSSHGGELLVKTCARLGVHYADTSDEFYWQRRMVDGYDALARATGARVVLASGFCAMAADTGAQLAIGRLTPRNHTDVWVDAWLERYNGGLSAGVLNTVKTMKNATYPKDWDTDPYVLVPDVDEALRVDTTVTGMGKGAWARHEGPVVQNLFGPYDARLLRRSFARLSQRVHLRVGAPPSMYAEWSAFLLEHPGSWSTLAKCPTPAILEGGRWRMRVRASAGGAGSAATVVLSGPGDPGYVFTASGLAEGGLCLAGKTAGCLRKAVNGGVLTTAAALDTAVLQRRLEAAGLMRLTSMDGLEIVV
mmetsp:Transcript_76742/g.238322  ORF Transcript_76742/g.238322 Transcript_76742/m.238322 type:complete len:412 (-) Transcript_76742:197-1432(-)